MDPALSACLLLATYGCALWYSHGEYVPLAILTTFVVFGLLCTVFLAEFKTVMREKTADRILSALFVVFFGLVLYNPMLRNFSNVYATVAMRGFLLLSALGFGLFQFPRTRRAGFWVTMVALAQAHFLVLLADPEPAIDIWLFYRKASLHFLAGENPYMQVDYPEIYRGRYGYPPGLHYLPASVYLLAPFQYLFGEVRVGLWAAQVACALLLGHLARLRGLSERVQGLAVLVWLMFPSTFPVLENCWMDTLVGVWTLAALVLWLQGRFGGAAVCLALALCSKQTTLVIALVTAAFFLWQPRFRGPGLRSLGLATLGAGLMMLPYALWDWTSYWSSVTQVFRNDVRLDSFNLIAVAINAYRLKVEIWQTLFIYAALVPIVIWRMTRREEWADWAGGVTMLLGLTFYFGKQAFLNYYDLLALFVMSYLLLSLKPGDAAESREPPP